MDDDVLGKVLHIEKEINDQFETERAKAEQRLEKLKEDMEKKVAAEELRMQEPFNNAVKNAESDTEEKVADIIKNAKVKAGLLESLSDDTLNRIISGHINCILPGK